MQKKYLILFFFCLFQIFHGYAQKQEKNGYLINKRTLDTSNYLVPSKYYQKGLLIYKNYFENEVSYKDSKFNNIVKIISTDFEDQIDFTNVNFNNNVILRDLTLHGDVCFDNAKFSHYASFSDLVFEDLSEMTFNRTKLPDTLIFDYNSKIPIIDFTTANFRKETDKHSISLMNTDISKLKLDYIHFKLIWINYANFPMTIEEKETVYEALLNNFKVHGQSESYKYLDIEYKNFQWRNRHLTILSSISNIWWTYGYNKELIFFWTFGFIILFTLLSFFWLNYLNFKVYRLKNIPLIPEIIFYTNNIKSKSNNEEIILRWNDIYKKKPDKLLLKMIGNRLWYSFVYTTNIFFRFTLNMDELKYSQKKGVIYLLLVYLIGIICIAYLANFVIQK